MLDALARIGTYTEGMNKASFRESPLVVDAVIRNIAVLGEAARNVPESIQELHPDVPWEKMQSMRNFIVHEYFGVSVDIVWTTTTDDLPAVEPLLLRLLDEGSEK